MVRQQSFSGEIVKGTGQAAFFTQLDWVVEQSVAKLGFTPFPGTLNLKLTDDCNITRELLAFGDVIELIPPDDSFCSAQVVPVELEGIRAVVIIPEEKVRLHGWDIMEIMAPVNLQKALGKQEGDLVSGIFVDAAARHQRTPLKVTSKLEVETVMLDLDGTIIDSVGIYYEIVKVTLRELNLPQVSTAQIRQANRDGRFLWEKLFPEDMFGDQAHLQDEAWAIARRISPEMFKQRVTLLPGAADSLRKAAACGLKLALVTSTPQQNMPAKLEPLQAAGVFDLLQEIITADDTELRKPSADPLLECCRRLAVDPGGAVYIGDTLIDIQAGKAAGTGTIGVLTGFDTGAMLQEENPDAIIPSLAELSEVIRLENK
jgi:HAD superfamily hydrolase (TIGR01549 family)